MKPQTESHDMQTIVKQLQREIKSSLDYFIRHSPNARSHKIKVEVTTNNTPWYFAHAWCGERTISGGSSESVETAIKNAIAAYTEEREIQQLRAEIASRRAVAVEGGA